MTRTVSRRVAPITVGAALILLTTGGIATADTGPASAVDATGAVDGRYLVVLDESATTSADELASHYGGTVTHTYRTALSGFAVSLEAAAAHRLAADPNVAAVEAVRAIDTTAADAAPGHPGLDRIDQRDLPLDGEYRHPDSAGSGVTTYVIDSGVRFGHRQFDGRASSGPDFVDDDDVADDCLGNGTAIAGVAAGSDYGVAKQSTIVGVRVLDCQGGGTTEDVVAAIDWVARDAAGKAAVATIGFGGGPNTAVDTAIDGAIASGVTFALPAGGSGSDACRFSPGRVAAALTVGGTVTTTAAHTGDTATTGFAGTTAAAAHVAGAAALYLADHPSADPDAVAAALTGAATPGKVTDPGQGSPNLLLYTGFMNPGRV